jgi:hypothetical protein
MERLLRQAQHYGGVLTDRVKHHRSLELGGNFANDVDALGFEYFQMGQVVTAAGHPNSCLVMSYRTISWLITTCDRVNRRQELKCSAFLLARRASERTRLRE